MKPTNFYANYRDNGFVFDNSILTRYCLSLYTKPFVILSGISGTGKTKIAQLFKAEDNQEELLREAEEAKSSLGDDSFILLNLTNGILNGDGRGNFKFKDFQAIYEEEEIPRIENKIQEIKEKGVADNITDLERISIITPDDTEIKAAVYLQRASNPLLRVRFKSKRGESDPYNSQELLSEKFNLDDTLKLTKVGKRRFKVVSVNNEEVVQAEKKISAKEAALIDNSHFVAVKSNWTDSTEIFGHYNLLSEKYHVTDTLKFIMLANEYPNRPFFLILDEMNLSKVEYYLSDFLSCLESRYLKDGEINQEPITLHNFSTYVDSDDNYFDIIPGKLNLPQNLYVTGTVNIDETTYMFSPKVLDRSNVIEFNEVDIKKYLNVDNGENDSTYTLSSFPDFRKNSLATREAFIKAPEKFKNTVEDLINLLKPYHLHFGYRVINEMSAYLENSRVYVSENEEVLYKSMDFQIVQKILPKFNGSFGKLDEPIRKLIAYLSEEPIDFNTINFESINSDDITTTKFPVSQQKLISMYKALLTNGFASYLE